MYQQLGQFIEKNRNQLAQDIVHRIYATATGPSERYGEYGRLRCLEDTNYHLRYLAEAIESEESALFADYVAWVKVLFKHINLPIEDLVQTLLIMQDILHEHTSADAHSILNTYIKDVLTQLESFPVTPPLYKPDGAMLSDLMHEYLETLLHGNRQAASEMIMTAVESGTKITDLYLHVFQPAQYEIGRLWQINEISVAQEHYCTAASQMIMSQLYPYIFTTAKNGRWFVGTSIAEELHELGIRMVADFFELEGWDTYYLGANMPVRSIVQAIAERKADVLGISATMTFHIKHVKAVIAAVRAAEECQNVKIIVGGRPFNIAPNLWSQIGADGYAMNAADAVTIATRLVSGQS